MTQLKTTFTKALDLDGTCLDVSHRPNNYIGKPHIHDLIIFGMSLICLIIAVVSLFI